jgi:hypothetical protein
MPVYPVRYAGFYLIKFSPELLQKMRTSKDEYLTLDGRFIMVSQNDKPPHGAKIWNGYDYTNQYWVFNGQRDVRTLEELQQAITNSNL